ncbi:MAG: hypothetical protein IJP12_01760 [Methanobrevibacter sp.]|nr:hypothetical protein [Methanobrevibacter sp.]
MTLRIIKNNKIKSNKKFFDRFLEKFHDNEKTFTIDCESLNIDYFNSLSEITIRHRKPAKDSIYYTSINKSTDEYTYFFGLARENVVATSSYMTMGAQIKPILVAVLNLEDSSKSNIVFAEDSDEFNNVILLRIDCSELSEDELLVLKNKNKITKLKEGKGFINFGAIGDFKTLVNIRNFISNVEFEYDNGIFAKIIRVSIPSNFNSLNAKPDSDIIKDRFYNFNKFNSGLEDVIDSNLEDNSSFSSDSSKTINKISRSKDYSNISSSKDNDSLFNKDSNVDENKIKFYDSDFEDNSLSLEENSSDLIKEDSFSLELTNDSDSLLYKNYITEDNEFYLDMSIGRNEFFKIMKILNNLIDSYMCDLDYIEVLDMGDELLNISSIILTNSEGNIKIIERILINNGFELF